jgi:hypothetical protein
MVWIRFKKTSNLPEALWAAALKVISKSIAILVKRP